MRDTCLCMAEADIVSYRLPGHIGLRIFIGTISLPCRDQRLYKQAVSPSVQPPEPLTPEGKLRFADGILDAGRQRIITVQEDHSGSGEAVNTIAAICEQASSLTNHLSLCTYVWMC